MREVLSDPGIGNFEVSLCKDRPCQEWRRQISGFFAKRSRDELLLLYISGHGVKDEAGRLYFAATDTLQDDLLATGVAATFIQEASSRNRRGPVVLILDTCYSGAFTKGLQLKASRSVNFADYFGDSTGGTAVITASSAIQYAQDGDKAGERAQPSLFSKHLIEGLRTGKADKNGDGLVSLDDLFSYLREALGAETRSQRPERSYFAINGELVVASNPAPRAGELPEEISRLARNEWPEGRMRAVRQLELLLGGKSVPLALAARQALERLKEDDSRMVAAATSAVLRRAGHVVEGPAGHQSERQTEPARKAEEDGTIRSGRPWDAWRRRTRATLLCLFVACLIVDLALLLHRTAVPMGSRPATAAALSQSMAGEAMLSVSDDPSVGVIDLDIEHDGTVIWNGTRVGQVPGAGIALLERYFRTEATVRPQPEVQLRPRDRALYGSVVAVLAAARRNGMKRIAFSNIAEFGN